MKMYRLSIRGNVDNFSITYRFATNYMDYNSFEFIGTEQEKYSKFLNELYRNFAPQPIYIDVKLKNQKIDRALARKEVFGIKDVNDFIKRLYK